MMKRTLILTLLAALHLGLRAADYKYLVFTLTDHTERAIASENLNITFSDGNLVATNGTTTLATIPLSSLSEMVFSETGISGISLITTDGLATDQMTVYDMNGRQIPAGTALPKGVYILKGQGRTIKMQVR